MGCLPDTLRLTDDQAKLLMAIANHARQGDAIPLNRILSQESDLPHRRARVCLMYLEEAGILDREDGGYQLAPYIIIDPLLARVAIFAADACQHAPENRLPARELTWQISQQFAFSRAAAAELVYELTGIDYLEEDESTYIKSGGPTDYERIYLERLAASDEPRPAA